MRILEPALGLLSLALLGGCTGRAPAAPVVGGGRVPSTRAQGESACEVARDLRKEAAALYANGKLDRTVRTLRKADLLCRQGASSSAELERKALDELGLAEGAAPAGPKEGEELLRQGISRKAQGDPVGAQKLFDRARVSLERAASSKAVLEVEMGIWNASAMAWSADGSRLAIASGQEIHLLDGEGMKRSLRLHTESGPLSTVAISPDSSVLASSAPDRDLELWSVASGARIGTLKNGHGELPTLVFSPDGQTLAGRTWENAAPILWSLESRQPLRTLDPIDRSGMGLGLRGTTDRGGAWSQMLAFSPDGRGLWGAHMSTLAFWDLRSADAGISRVLRATNPKLANEDLDSVAFHPNGHRLAVGTESGKVMVWNLSGGPSRTLQAHKERPQIRFSRDGKRLLSVSLDGTVRAFNANTLEPLGSAQAKWPIVDSVAPHPDAQRAAIAGQGELLIADVSTGSHQEAIRPPLAFSTVAIDQSGRQMALGTPSGPIALVSLRDGSFGWMSGHTANVESLAFSPDGRSLASVSLDKTARLWDVAGYRSQRVLVHPKGLHSIAFRPDGQTLATSGDEGMVRIWDASTGDLVASPSGTSCAVVTVAYSSTGSVLIANVSDHSILRWNATDYTELPHVKTGNPCVGEIRASASTLGLLGDGTLIASAPSGNEIDLFSAQTGERQATLSTDDQVRSLAVRRGDSVLVAAMGRAVRRWQLPGSTELSPLALPTPTDTADSLAFSADGRLLVGASLRGTVSVWAMPSGALLLALRWMTESSAFAIARNGLADWLGATKPDVSCRLGVRFYPAELCEERYWTPGLVSKVLSAPDSLVVED